MLGQDFFYVFVVMSNSGMRLFWLNCCSFVCGIKSRSHPGIKPFPSEAQTKEDESCKPNCGICARDVSELLAHSSL